MPLACGDGWSSYAWDAWCFYPASLPCRPFPLRLPYRLSLQSPWKLRFFTPCHKVEPTVYHQLPAYAITLRTPKGVVWIAVMGLNQVQLRLSRVYQPYRTAAISVGVTQNRALSSVGGGHVVSYRTLGQDWILNILVETEKVFVVTVNQHSGYVVSVDDS